MDDETPLEPIPREIEKQLNAMEAGKRQRVLNAIIAAALGSIPWVGGVIAAMLAFRDESAQMEVDSLQRQWLEEHKARLEKLGSELESLTTRLGAFGEEISTRLESEEYLAIIRKGFRVWDQADTDQMRSYVGRLLANAGATKLCDDDRGVARLDG